MNEETRNRAKSLAEDASERLAELARLLDEDAPCPQIAESIGNVKAALSSLGAYLLASHLEEAVLNCDPNDPEAIARLRADIENAMSRVRGWRLSPEA